MALTQIHGKSGTLDAKKLIKSLVLRVISPETLALFTWTGKTQNKGSRKFALKKYKRLTELLYEVLRAADSRYSMAYFSKDMVTKVMKQAYMGGEEANVNRFV